MKEFHWRSIGASKADVTHLGRRASNAGTLVSVPCMEERQDARFVLQVPVDDQRPKCATCFPAPAPSIVKKYAKTKEEDPEPMPPTPSPRIVNSTESFLPEEVFEAIEIPKRKGVRDALRVINATPGISLHALSQRIGLDPRPTGAVAKALHKKGLIEVRLAYQGGREERLHYLAGNLAAARLVVA